MGYRHRISLHVLGAIAVLAALLTTVQAPAGAVDAPAFVSPVNGQVLGTDGAYLFNVTDVAGAAGYQWQLVQGLGTPDEVILERDTEFSALGIFMDMPEHGLFGPGPVIVSVRAVAGDGTPDSDWATIAITLDAPDGSFLFPAAGQAIDLEGAYLAEIDPIADAVSYEWILQQGFGLPSITSVTRTTSGTGFGLFPDGDDAIDHALFRSGPVVLSVRANLAGGGTTAFVSRSFTLVPRVPRFAVPAEDGAELDPGADYVFSVVDDGFDDATYQWVVEQNGSPITVLESGNRLTIPVGSAPHDAIRDGELDVSVRRRHPRGESADATRTVTVLPVPPGEADVVVTFLNARSCEGETPADPLIAGCVDGPNGDAGEVTRLTPSLRADSGIVSPGAVPWDETTGDFNGGRGLSYPIRVDTVNGIGSFEMNINHLVPAGGGASFVTPLDINPFEADETLTIRINTRTDTWEIVGQFASTNRSWSVGDGGSGVLPALVNFDVAIGASDVGAIDVDDDGLLDNWEREGRVFEVVSIDSTVTGPTILHREDLHGAGARVGVGDVFVEFDWVGTSPAIVSRAAGRFCSPDPSGTEDWVRYPGPLGDNGAFGGWDDCGWTFDDVHAAFARHGMALHVDSGTFSSIDLPARGVNDPTGFGVDLGGGGRITLDPFCLVNDTIDDFAQIEAENMDRDRRWFFRYFLQGDPSWECDTGGGSPIGSNEVYLSRGDASAFMHELGHTLGLDHSGLTGDNCAPNHVSIMNYRYATGQPGAAFVQPDGSIEWVLDFAPVAVPNSGGRPVALGDTIDITVPRVEADPLTPETTELRFSFTSLGTDPLSPGFGFRTSYGTNNTGFDLNNDGDVDDTVTPRAFDLSTLCEVDFDDRDTLLEAPNDWALVEIDFLEFVELDDVGNILDAPGELDDRFAFDPSITIADDLGVTLPGGASLGASAGASTPSVAPGGAVDLTVEITNDGPGDATGVVLAIEIAGADPSSLPAGCAAEPDLGALCSLGDLLGGAATSVTITLVPTGTEAITVDLVVDGVGGPAATIQAPVEVTVETDAPPDGPCAPGQDGVIYGTDGHDVLFGTRGDDIICGLGGDDIIFAGRGADTVHSGDGHDLVFGGRGPDIIEAGSGDDIVFGDRGKDRIDGGDGHDLGFGGSGRDVCTAVERRFSCRQTSTRP